MARHRFPYTNLSVTYEPGTFSDISGTPLGQAIWGFLLQPHILGSLEVAGRLGAAPVSAISDELLATFGDLTGGTPREQLERGLATRFPQGTSVSFDRSKQMLGHMIRQIMEALGYQLRSKNSPAKDPLGIFTTSARYEPA